jgi:hypothetical protein
VGLNLVSFKIVNGNGVKAMPGSIPAPNPGSLYENKKNTARQMGHAKNIFKNEKNENHSNIFTAHANYF